MSRAEGVAGNFDRAAELFRRLRHAEFVKSHHFVVPLKPEKST